MFLVIGSNMTEAHPVASTFLKNAVLNGAKLIVVDPRRHALADFADLYVPIQVGTDIAFLNSVMHVLIKENLHDKKFATTCCVNFDALKDKVAEYPPEKAAQICGIPAEMIRDVALRLAKTKPAMLCYTLGITEHTCGKNNVMSTANLQMLLGNMGVECGGVNPLRGQNNVQGACDMAALPNVFPGYQKVTDPDSRTKFASAWGVKQLPDKPGLTIPAMLDGLLDHSVKAFYIFGENLANTEPDIKHVEHCLESAEFVVCQDIFPTETTRFAHVIFPSAAWCEDDGTFTNSERRVNRVRKVSEPPGEARPNWWIIKELAKRMGQDWKNNSSQEIWDEEISRLVPQFAGIKYKRIEKNGLQWPCPDESHPGTCFLHQDGEFTCGLGQFQGVDWTPPAEVPDQEYPLILSTGRRLYHYHTRTMTGRAQGINDLLGEETVDISPQDAAALNILQGEMIQISSRRGRISAKAKVSDRIPPGMVWMAFHFRDACANWLTNPAYDPETMTAEYKACAVRIEKL